MALKYVQINRNETGPVLNNLGQDIAPNFSHYELWGGKDVRNKTGDVHDLAEAVVRAYQIIRDWANAINPEVGVEVTSTYRTKVYQRDVINNGVTNSPHTKRIAGDGKFVPLEGSLLKASEVKIEFIKRYNTAIRDKEQLFYDLRDVGINGFGLYGPGGPNKYYDFFHLDARNKALGVHGPFTDKPGLHDDHDKTYGIWTRGNPRYLEDDESSIVDNEGNDTSGGETPVLTDEQNAYEYVIKGDDPYSFEELVKDPDFIGYGADPVVLLNHKHQGVTNHRRLYDTLPEHQQIQFYPEGYDAGIVVILARGAVIYVPTKEVGLTKPASSGQTPTTTENSAVSYEYGGNFLDEERATIGEFYPYILKRLTLDPGYVPTYRSRGLNSKDVYPQISIFAWSRTLFNQGHSGWIQLTEDIFGCSVHDDMNGGNFTIDLSPVMGSLDIHLDANDEQPIWEKVGEISPGTSQTIQTRQNYYRRETGKNDVAVEHLVNDSYYERVLNQNDLIFISFEQLQLDDLRGANEIVDPSGKWFDMIGLVDHVSEGVNSMGMTSINVTGRDLTKALINDKAYFSPYSIGHASSMYGGEVGKNGRYFQGEFKDFAVFQARTIKEQIDFVVHRIASIGYVPDDIFQGFLNKTDITTFRKVGDEVDERKEARGIWKIFKLFIDSKIADMRVADLSLTNPQGSILELMQSICQEPFVQFMTQTIGDKFYLIARRAPFDQASYEELFSAIIPTYDFSSTGDGSLSGEANGGSANAYRRYLEELEQQKIQSDQKEVEIAEELGIQYLDDATVEATIFPLIINVGAEDVASSTLQMEDQSYAWYQIENTGDFLGKSQGLGYIPAIYFDEYAQVFGNERLKVTSNYTNFQHLLYEERDNDFENIAQHTARLLSFIVETHIYLPFTRKGTITLQVGDRRIKKGNFIYYRPTREVFYVDAVDHQARVNNTGIERTTTIQVSRGMVADFLRPETVIVDDEEVSVSYFTLVDLPKLKADLEAVALRGTQTERLDYKADFAVNEKVLKFFLANRQFRRL